MELWVAKGHPASLSSREGLSGACGDQGALLLGQRGKEMQDKGVNVGAKLETRTEPYGPSDPG